MSTPVSRPTSEPDDGASRLDPPDPSAFRAVAHELLDACLDRLENARERPWRAPDDDVPGGGESPPREGVPIERVAEELVRDIMPSATGNTHPRFFGWVHGTGLASGLLAEMVAATMNSNCGGRRHGAIDVERRVIDWCARLHGMPEAAGGLVTSGTSLATLIALCAARVHVFGASVRRTGMVDASLRPRVYAADGAHQCVAKAMEVIGLGRDALVSVPIDPVSGSLSLAALDRAIAADRAAGLDPFCLVGTAGSVDIGRSDDLGALADAAARHGLWLHVDAAFGAWAVLAEPPWCDAVRDLGRADSVAFDFHKWPYVQYDAGAVLVRDARLLTDAFAGDAAYLSAEDEGLAAGEPWPCDLGIELSRGFRALKVWTALRAHGTEALGASITDNCRQAARLAALVEASPELELAAPVALNICCFALKESLTRDTDPDALHRAIAAHLQLSGECVLSTTRIGERLVLRAAIVNHRTTDADITLTVEAVCREARARLPLEAARSGRTDGNSFDATE